jgi:integrase
LCIGNETGEPGRAGVDAVVCLDGPSFFAVRRAFGGTLSSAASLAYVDAAIKTKQSPMILVNSEGRPWTPDGFRASWGKACKRAKIEGVTFSDLRGTAVTRLATGRLFRIGDRHHHGP